MRHATGCPHEGLLPLDTPKLTPRERETITLAAQYGDAEVARIMGLSEQTVKLYLHNARLKHRDVLDMRRLSV